MEKTLKLNRLASGRLVVDKNTYNQLLTSFESYKQCINKTLLLFVKYVKDYPEIIRNRYGLRDIAMGYDSKFIQSISVPKTVQKKIQSEFDKICNSAGITAKKVRRDILMIAGSNLLAIRKRHGKIPQKNPSIKNNKEIRTDDEGFKLLKENDKWYFFTEIIENTPIKCEFKPFSNSQSNYLNSLVEKKKCGGTLKLHNKSKSFILKLRTQREFKAIYKHVNALGLDVNNRPDAYISFSDKTKIEKPQKLQTLCKRCNELNKKINSPNLSTKQRKFFRKQWINIQRAIKAEAAKLVDCILEKVVKNKFLLCIDGAKPGSRSGEYGQIITTLLLTECENRGIPHIWVDSYHTSTTCVVCNHRDKKSRISETEFKCTNCGHGEDADIHAAKYIAKIGLEAYNK